MSALNNENQQPLPGLDSRPDAEVLVYDGFCSFCHGQMRVLHKLDLTGQLAYLSLHDELSNELLPGMSFEEKMQAIVLIDRKGARHLGAEAFRVLSRRLPLLWWLMPLLHIPGSLGLWQWLYKKVAAVRYRFGRRQCDGGTCELHGYGSSGR